MKKSRFLLIFGVLIIALFAMNPIIKQDYLKFDHPIHKIKKKTPKKKLTFLVGVIHLKDFIKRR